MGSKLHNFQSRLLWIRKGMTANCVCHRDHCRPRPILFTVLGLHVLQTTTLHAKTQKTATHTLNYGLSITLLQWSNCTGTMNGLFTLGNVYWIVGLSCPWIRSNLYLTANNCLNACFYLTGRFLCYTAVRRLELRISLIVQVSTAFHIKSTLGLLQTKNAQRKKTKISIYNVCIL